MVISSKVEITVLALKEQKAKMEQRRITVWLSLIRLIVNLECCRVQRK